MKWPWVSRARYERDLRLAFESRDAARRAYQELADSLGPPTYRGIPLEFAKEPSRERAVELGDPTEEVIKRERDGKLFRWPRGCYYPAGYSYSHGPPVPVKDLALPRLGVGR